MGQGFGGRCPLVHFEGTAVQPESVRFRRMYADTCGSSAQNWHTFCWSARKVRVGRLCAFRETLFAPTPAFILPCVVSSLCMGRSRCVWVGQPPVLSTSASIIPWWVGGFPHFFSFFRLFPLSRHVAGVLNLPHSSVSVASGFWGHSVRVVQPPEQSTDATAISLPPCASFGRNMWF